MVTRAVASEPPATAPPRTFAQQAGETGADIVARLGSARTAGTWIRADGKPVVAVTDAKAAAEVRAAGAEVETQPSVRDCVLNEVARRLRELEPEKAP